MYNMLWQGGVRQWVMVVSEFLMILCTVCNNGEQLICAVCVILMQQILGARLQSWQLKWNLTILWNGQKLCWKQHPTHRRLPPETFSLKHCLHFRLQFGNTGMCNRPKRLLLGPTVFPRAAEFRAESRNLAVAAEFSYFREISRNSE